jgi:hypothetical protein
VAHSDDELRADKDCDLAERDGFRLVDIARGPKDDEQRFAVALQLRTLMGLDRVLDREFMRSNASATAANSSSLGSYSPSHAIASPALHAACSSAKLCGSATRRPSR